MDASGTFKVNPLGHPIHEGLLRQDLKKVAYHLQRSGFIMPAEPNRSSTKESHCMP